MLFLHSLLFNIAFYAWLILLMVAGLPLLLVPYRYIWLLPRLWAYGSLWLLKVIVGLRYEVKGLDNKPEGGVLVAAKHQSFWETFALVTITKQPANIAKRELSYIPFFGWYLWKFSQIAVNRTRGSGALKSLLPQAREKIADGRDVVIFPEGTRRPVGAPPAYKYGIVALYKTLNAPVVPVALNAGMYWPRRTFLRYPGTITIEVLPPIYPGLDDDVFRERLSQAIEAASNRLINEARGRGEGKPERESPAD